MPSTLAQLQSLVIRFRNARDWAQFHNPKDAALSLVLEAAELLELTQWKNGDELVAHLKRRKRAVGEELADVLYWVLLVAHDQGIDLETAFRKKLRLNARKYPVRLSRGSSRKYSRRAR
jgi:NTP pyrophosphatase (non-canonical NTP hydrolase)